jgi:hypothetical protein
VHFVCVAIRSACLMTCLMLMKYVPLFFIIMVNKTSHVVLLHVSKLFATNKFALNLDKREVTKSAVNNSPCCPFSHSELCSDCSQFLEEGERHS